MSTLLHNCQGCPIETSACHPPCPSPLLAVRLDTPPPSNTLEIMHCGWWCTPKMEEAGPLQPWLEKRHHQPGALNLHCIPARSKGLSYFESLCELGLLVISYLPLPEGNQVRVYGGTTKPEGRGRRNTLCSLGAFSFNFWIKAKNLGVKE